MRSSLLDAILMPEDISKINVPVSKRGTKMIRLSFNKGYFPGPQTLSKIYEMPELFSSKEEESTFFKRLFEHYQDINYIDYYKGDDPEVFKTCFYNSSNPYEYSGENIETWEKFIKVIPFFIRGYHGDNIEIYKMAIEMGAEQYITYYGDNIEIFKNIMDKKTGQYINYSGENIEIWKLCLQVKPEAIYNYHGENIEIYKMAIEMGAGQYVNYYGEDIEIWKLCLQVNPETISNYRGENIEIYKMAIEMGAEQYIKYYGEDIEIWKLCLQANPETNSYYRGENIEIYKLAIEMGAGQYINYYGEDIEIWKLCLQVNPKAIAGYHGENIEIYKMAIETGYGQYIRHFMIDDETWKKILKIQPSLIINYKNENIEIFKIAIEMGAGQFISYYGKDIGIWKLIVQARPEAITDYSGDSIEIYKIAIEMGAGQYIKYYGENIEIWKLCLQVNPKMISYYRGENIEIYKLAIEMGAGQYINYYREDIEIWKLIIRVNPHAIINYRGENIEIYKLAIEMGVEEIYIRYSGNDKEIWKLCLRANPKMISKYKGENIEIYKLAIEMGAGRYIMYFGKNDEIWGLIVQVNPGMLSLYNGDNIEIVKVAMKQGYFNYGGNNIEIWRMLIETKPKAISKYRGENIEVYKMAIEMGYGQYIEYYGDNIEIWRMVIQVNPKAIANYKGENVEVYKMAIEMGYGQYINYYGDNIEIWRMVIQVNPKAIAYYNGDNIEIVKMAMEQGYFNYGGSNIEIWRMLVQTQPSSIVYYGGDDVQFVKEQFQINEFLNLEAIVSNRNYINLFKTSEELFSLMKQKYNIFINVDEFEIIAMANNLMVDNKIKFIKNYEKIMKFIDDCHISRDEFIKYSLNTSRFDYINNIQMIWDNTNAFLKCKKYFDTYYFDIDKLNLVKQIEAFNLMLTAYNKYGELFNNIALLDRGLTEEEKKCFEILINDIKTDYNGEQFPKDINEITNINHIKEDTLKELIDECKDITDSDLLKNKMCNLLFNQDLRNVIMLLINFGNAEELKYLKFLNKDKPVLCDRINEIIILTEMMETVVGASDVEFLRGTLLKMVNNIEIVNEFSIIFNKYEEMMREMYQNEAEENFTKIAIQEKNMEASNEYGVECVSLNDKKYVLYAHVKSHSETVEELVSGVAATGHNFICLSAISNRNQKYYYNGMNSIIFGYDHLPKGNFIYSSISNMGSNYFLNDNSSEVSIEMFMQRGILEESMAPSGSNSEILCYRDGLKPSCIIVPQEHAITQEQIEIAKKYNLKIVFTQRNMQKINNPQETIKEIKETEIKENKNEIEKLKQMKNNLLNTTKDAPRRIAVFTDAHALYEPTLAILEDARKRGITEIYSLGDNVGTGPNPKEVMDLLKEYGVISLEGNHEMYVKNEIDSLREHLTRTHALEEAERMGKWTSGKLTKEQMEEIRKMPKEKVIELGGKKIMLRHYIKNYNDDSKNEIDTQEYDKILQGHVHFKSSNDNIMTLRGAGIGGESSDAYYVILKENKDGGYEIKEVQVPIRNYFIEHSINETDMEEQDKNKISSWTK